MDEVSETRLALVAPPLAAKIRAIDDAMVAKGEDARAVQGLRTWQEQDDLWNQGRTTPGPPCTHDGVVRPIGTCTQHPLGAHVTNCRGGYSYHNFGMAVDLAPSKFGPGQPYAPDWKSTHPIWKDMESIGQSLGLESGATWRSFPDAPHFQYTGKFPVGSPDDEVRELFNSGGNSAVWQASGIMGVELSH